VCLSNCVCKDAKGKELKPAALGKSADVKVGDRVVAIGNALGQFQNTVTSGIISGFGRSIQAGDSSGSAQTETLLNLFQTDASINQGNSGGPLVNLKGEVIGINTAVAGGGAENIGFAIPIDDIQPLIKTVLDKGKLERPYLGVRYASITADLAYTYNLPVQEGAYIIPSRNSASIVSGSPAEKAGLQEKDIITKIAGEAITPKRSLVSILGSKSVGDKVDLTILRDGKEQTITVTLEAAPNN
jgi:serine protease Do